MPTPSGWVLAPPFADRVGWTTQPPRLVGIDWSNPLTRGLTYAVAPGCYSPTLSSQAGTIVRANSAGLATYFNGSSSTYVQANGDIGKDTGGTIVVMHRSTVLPPNGPTYAHILACTTGVASGDYDGFILGLGNGNGCPFINVYANTSLDNGVASGAVALNDGRVHLTAGVYSELDGGPITMYVDGKIVGSGNRAFPPETGYHALRFGSSPHTFWGGFDGERNFAAFFKRQLNAIEVASLSANPWQLFSADY